MKYKINIPRLCRGIIYFIAYIFSSLFPAHRASASLARSGSMKGNTHLERAARSVMGPFVSP